MKNRQIVDIDYSQISTTPLGIDINKISDLIQENINSDGSTSVGESLHTPVRMSFYDIILITKGSLEQKIDFQSYTQQAGQLVIVHPEQVRQIITLDQRKEALEGWGIIFQPILLFSALNLESYQKLWQDFNELPTLLQLSPEGLERIKRFMQQMNEFKQLSADSTSLGTLLRLQLYSLLHLLIIESNSHHQEQTQQLSKGYKRFILFKELLDQHYTSEHQLSFYVEKLFTTEKSLSRSCFEVTGINAKSYILKRICLEAKRLLVHTDLSIKQISDHLGYDEVTNFSKFFKRDTGLTPSAFRQQELQASTPLKRAI